MKIGLQRLHHFLTKKLPPKIMVHYRNFDILNESDLQFYVTYYLKAFLRKDDEKGRLDLHCCLHCFDLKSGRKTYPDILIKHRGKPWVIIELKESSQVKKLTATEERQKIAHQRKTMEAKRGYLMYVGRWGKHRLLRGRKGPYGFWFYEVPIVMERYGTPDDKIAQFDQQFRQRAKYVCP